jgi:hypothetical protein
VESDISKLISRGGTKGIHSPSIEESWRRKEEGGGELGRRKGKMKRKEKERK